MLILQSKIFLGGGGGTRTHETLSGHGFPSRLFKPLTHPSKKLFHFYGVVKRIKIIIPFFIAGTIYIIKIKIICQCFSHSQKLF